MAAPLANSPARATFAVAASRAAMPRAAVKASAGAAPAATATVQTADTASFSSSSPQAVFDAAFTAARQAPTTAAVRAQITLMSRALELLKAGGITDIPPLQADLDAMSQRAAVLPLFTNAPEIPVSTVVRAPSSSNVAPTAAQARQARGWSGAAALQKLTPPDQKRFQDLSKQLNATGQLALQALLAKGALTPAVLAGLVALAAAPLASGVDRGELLSAATTELNDPVTISQKSRDTCGATCVQILIALREPALYLELLKGLASPGGQAALPANGGTLQRASDWLAADGGRSVTSRLLQPALIDLADGALDYSNTRDKDLNPVTRGEQPAGLQVNEAAFLLTAVTAGHPAYTTIGNGYAASLTPDETQGLDRNIAGAVQLLAAQQNPKAIDAASEKQLVAQIAAAASPSDPIYCTVVYNLAQTGAPRPGFHAVLVTGVKDDKVNFINPWGREESVPRGVFEQMVSSAEVRDPSASAPTLAATFSPTTGDPLYTVRPGDTVYSIALDMLGDARRWTDLAYPNRQQLPDLLTQPATLKPGMVLDLPPG